MIRSCDQVSGGCVGSSGWNVNLRHLRVCAFFNSPHEPRSTLRTISVWVAVRVRAWQTLDGDPRVAVDIKRVMVRNCDYAAFRGKARSRHAEHEGVPVYGV